MNRTYSLDGRGPQSRTFHIDYISDMYIKIYVFEHADYEYEG